MIACNPLLTSLKNSRCSLHFYNQEAGQLCEDVLACMFLYGTLHTLLPGFLLLRSRTFTRVHVLLSTCS